MDYTKLLYFSVEIKISVPQHFQKCYIKFVIFIFSLKLSIYVMFCVKAGCIAWRSSASWKFWVGAWDSGVTWYCLATTIVVACRCAITYLTRAAASTEKDRKHQMREMRGRAHKTNWGEQSLLYDMRTLSWWICRMWKKSDADDPSLTFWRKLMRAWALNFTTQKILFKARP